MQDSVIRYVVTVPLDGHAGRKMMLPAQGRHTHATPDAAQAWIDGYFANNSQSIIDEVGRDLQVRPCKCYPGHFDPMMVYFDIPDDDGASTKA